MAAATTKSATVQLSTLARTGPCGRARPRPRFEGGPSSLDTVLAAMSISKGTSRAGTAPVNLDATDAARRAAWPPACDLRQSRRGNLAKLWRSSAPGLRFGGVLVGRRRGWNHRALTIQRRVIGPIPSSRREKDATVLGVNDAGKCVAGVRRRYHPPAALPSVSLASEPPVTVDPHDSATIGPLRHGLSERSRRRVRNFLEGCVRMPRQRRRR